jgi:HK97 family phage major capsid protein/HK97 family phage prohead protease
MPWHVESDNPDCSGYAVVKDADGEVEGCHKTKADANAQMAALYASEEASMNETNPPRDNLVRAMSAGYEVSDGRTLSGHFARFNEWTLIDSAYEGRFMERIAPGAFRTTFATKQNQLRILFQHGKDPAVGDKPIAVPTVLREDDEGAYYEADLLDGVPPLIVDGLRRGQYGSSFRFRVRAEDFRRKPKVSDHNPEALPERTIREAEVFEFGPVTFPAYAGATATLRSMTDEFATIAISSDPERLRNLVSYVDPVAPDTGAGASPHPDEGRHEPVAPPTTQEPERKPKLSDQYVTRDEKSSRVTELKAALARQAVEYPGVLPADAQATWDSDTSELETLERDIAAWDERQERLRKFAGDETNRQGYTPPAIIRTKTETDIYDLDAVWSRSRSPEQRDQMLRDNAMRAVEQATFPHPASRPDEARSHIANLLDNVDNSQKELAQRILATGSPLYRRAFNKALVSANLSAEEQRAANAVVGTTATGGWMVPYQFDPTIVPLGAWTSINPYRQFCTVKQIVGGNVYNGVGASAITATRTTEAAVTTENAPTFEQFTLTVKRVQAQVSFSNETEQDRPDFVSEIARLLQEAKDTEEEAAFTLGDGAASAPFGLGGVHGTINGFWTLLDTAGAAVALTDYYLAEAALPLRWRSNAHWFMSRGMIRTTQAFETVYGELFGGQYYAAVGDPATNRFGNTGLRLLGYPVVETPSVPNTPSTVSTLWGMFGDPKQFYIIDRVGMNIEVIPHLFGGAQGRLTTGERAIYAMWRNTAGVFGLVSAPITSGLRLFVKS